MPRETQKDKIERLEKELLEHDNRIKELYSVIDEDRATISKMQNDADREFTNSPHRKHLTDKLFLLEEKLRVSQQDHARLKERLLSKDNHVKELEEKNAILKHENQDLSIKVSKKICERLEVEKELEELQSRLTTSEYWNNQNNIGDLTIKACKQGNRIKELEEELQKLKNENHTIKNARGAGRKSLLSDKKEEIKELREGGVKIKELAEKYNCSTGLIHKLINE